MNEWIELGKNKDGTHNICCGVCGVGKFKYCPNCGAKMADRKTEPQTDYKKWETPPKADIPTVNTNCVTVLASVFEDEPQTDCSWK